jgi:DNA-binding transcriptional regulator GbsR (MarR family)
MDISSGNLSRMVFRRVITDRLGEFSLDGQMLSVLMQIDGNLSVGDVARRTGLNMAAMRAVLSKLLKLNLIEAAGEAFSAIDQEFLSFLNARLSRAIGPIAEVLIDDAIVDLGHNRSRFPTHQAAELVDLLSRSIQREDKKMAFKQSMVKKIKEKGY